MLLLLVLAIAAPPSFVHAVEARLATTHMHLVDWWADDLDGDHVPESIALVCDDDAGLFLVQHGSDLLELPAPIHGRNMCPAASATPPAWRVVTSGVISYKNRHNHGYFGYLSAIRNGRLVLVREEYQGFDSGDYDIEHDGYMRHESDVDYDNLTWSERLRFVPSFHQPRPTTTPHKPEKQTSGTLVLITDRVRRNSRLVGQSTLAATRGPDATTLHIHADRALALRDCNITPCQTTRLAKGDSEIAVAAAASELEIVAGKTKIVVRFKPLEGEASYPPAQAGQ